MADLLSDAERQADLPALGRTGWQAVPGRDAIRKVMKFRDFSQAWGAMSRIALAAERLNHHPEWSNTYNALDIVLSTHDCGGLSALDVKLAHLVDRCAEGATVQSDHGAPVESLCESLRAERARR